MTPLVQLRPPVTTAVVAPPRFRAVPRHALGFFLFLLVNAALFIRPSEVVPALVGWNIYEFLMLACFAASLPVVLEQLSVKSLEGRPITVCVLGVLLTVVASLLANRAFSDVEAKGVGFAEVALSHVAHLDFTRVAVLCRDFAKVVLYYLLFVGLVDSTARLRRFLFWMLVFATAAVSLAVLQYHGVIHLSNLEQTFEGARDAFTGESRQIMRLNGSGMFQDPNDLGMLIVVSTLLSLYWLFDKPTGPARLLWVGPLALFLYAVSLTQSRGALLALLSGLCVFFLARFGWRTALLLAMVVVPVILLSLGGGRQTDFSTEEGTGQQRIQLWSDGLILARDYPLFGVGKDEYSSRVGLVAHNSYLHCFAELGVPGGMFFLGAFYLAGSQLARLGDRRKHALPDPESRRLRPYVCGVVAAWAIGMMSLTLCYLLPTYTILALAAAYIRTTPADPPAPIPRFDLRLLGRLLLVAAIGFAVIYVFVRLFVER